MIRQVEASRCFFAVLDSPGRSLRGTFRELLYGFEGLLPVPLDSAHAVFSHPINGVVVGCAMRREELGEIVAAMPDQAERLQPDALPGWVCEQVGEVDRQKVCASLNLLVGDFRSARSRSRLRTTRFVALGALVVAATALSVGAIHRAVAAESQASAVSGDIEELYESVLGNSLGGGAQPASIQLATLINRERARRHRGLTEDRRDIVESLALLSTSWPATDGARVSSLIEDGRRTRVTLSVPSNEAAASFIEKLEDGPVWRALSRSVTPRGGSVEVTLELERKQ